MDVDQVSVLRELLSDSGWIQRTDEFAGTMRKVTQRADGLLLVGTPDHEPWHLAAHLDNEAEFGGAVDLHPTLVRWSVPPGAPSHLATGLERLQVLRRGEPLLVVTAQSPSDLLLDHVDSARRRGGTIFALGALDSHLTDLAHEVLPLDSYAPAAVDLDVAEHLVSLSAVTLPGGPRGWRGSLRQVLDRICGA